MIYKTARKLEKFIKKNKDFDLYAYYDVNVVFISDSIIINYSPIEQKNDIPEPLYYLHSANTLLIIIKRLQTLIYKCLKEKNIFLRGGVSNNFCYIKDNFAFGEGLIEAYKTESKKAIYPRICLSDSVTNNSKLIEAFETICKMIYKAQYIRTENNISFIDYLTHNLNETQQSMTQIYVIISFFKVHKEAIENKLLEINLKIESEKDEDKLKSLNRVKDKFNWLKNYHNESLKGNYGDYFLIN